MMSPEERRIWLRLHGAPPEMVMLTRAELHDLEVPLKAGHATFALMAQELGPYYIAHAGNFLAAVRAAVQRGLRLARENAELRERLEKLSPHDEAKKTEVRPPGDGDGPAGGSPAAPTKLPPAP